jgi:hypothetical protein
MLEILEHLSASQLHLLRLHASSFTSHRAAQRSLEDATKLQTQPRDSQAEEERCWRYWNT